MKSSNRHHDARPYIVTLTKRDGSTEERYCVSGVHANALMQWIPLAQLAGQMLDVVRAKRRPALHGYN